MSEGIRADVFLVERGFASSRTEAQAAIRAGSVTANGKPVRAASQLLHDKLKIQYERPHPYVSRGGVKLAAALDYYGLSPEGRVCLDVGASTGGFTQVLLLRGATRVYAVDVGHGQLHHSLAPDTRIVSLEGLNARDLVRGHVNETVGVLVADVSFISLKLVLPAAFALTAKDAWMVLLVKPQFEVGPKGVGKGGIVTDEAAREAVLDDIITWVGRHDWRVLGTLASPITGGSGNHEYLLAAKRA